MRRQAFLVSAMVCAFFFSVAMAGAGGFDEFGYNRTARIFVGTAMDWCMGKVGDGVWCETYLDIYANDHLVMKWNREWDRGNQENWSNPPYFAWEDNEWNGKAPGGSGAVWHYKIVWVGPCTEGETLPNGGYCIWGQFETIMDHGVDPAYGPGHLFLTKAKPLGFGYYPLPP